MNRLEGTWAYPVVIAENNFVYKALSAWSLNVAVGCNHACRFCITGDALIQMADGRTKALQDVVVGDAILTVAETKNPEWSKRFVQATVTAKVETRKPAFRLRTLNAEIICSDDHRWLTTRGWKFTTGSEQGGNRRPHLKPRNQIYTIGSHLPPFGETEDYRKGYLAGLIRGDGVLGRYEYPNRHAHRPSKEVQNQFRLFLKDREPLLRAKKWLRQFGVETNDFVFKTNSPAYVGRQYPGIRSSRRSVVEKISALIAHNCYVPSASTNKMAQPLEALGVDDPDADWGEYVFVREWDETKFIQSLIRAELRPRDKLKFGSNRAVMLCTTTDPYQAIKDKPTMERLRLIVRRSLGLIHDISTLNVRILTRSPLAREDFDLMKLFGNRLMFGMSIPTLNEKLCKVYEPRAPSPRRRLETLIEASKSGLHTCADIGWDQLSSFLQSVIFNEIGSDAFCLWLDTMRNGRGV